MSLLEANESGINNEDGDDSNLQQQQLNESQSSFNADIWFFVGRYEYLCRRSLGLEPTPINSPSLSRKNTSRKLN